MITEAINKIQDLIQRANNVELVAFDDETAAYICNGEILEKRGIPPKRRDHWVATLPDLVEAVKAWGKGTTSIFVGNDAIIALLDDSCRRDRVLMPLNDSEALQNLMAMPRHCRAQQLLDYLRQKLPGCYDEAFYNSITQLRFSGHWKEDEEHAHGRQALGKSVEAEVKQTSGDELPTETTFNVEFFRGLAGYQRPLRYVLHMDVDNHAIGLHPWPDDLFHAIAGLRNEMADWLTGTLAKEGLEQQTVVFLGEPNMGGDD